MFGSMMIWPLHRSANRQTSLSCVSKCCEEDSSGLKHLSYDDTGSVSDSFLSVDVWVLSTIVASTFSVIMIGLL